ncbi:hypothetical protein H5410_021999 [Solanum commersonii]|uniref:Uncharacterized protein n=1 Tax=Solanum commersonii TaxID=4109 RepID=A0A9J5ZIK6_SOLCO|nr:hypothetical protein H5410_021999 [Solanum commersonii]
MPRWVQFKCVALSSGTKSTKGAVVENSSGKPPTCRLKNLANKLYFIMARTGTSANKNLSTLVTTPYYRASIRPMSLGKGLC